MMDSSVRLGERVCAPFGEHPPLEQAKEHLTVEQWRVVVADHIENALDWEVQEFAGIPNVEYPCAAGD
jgi:hypothetical protein